MTNIATSLCFSEEFEGSDVLSTIDQYRLCLKASTKLYSLNFNPSFFEKNDSFEVAIRKGFQKILFTKNAGGDGEGDLKRILKSLNTQGIHSIQTCNLSSHRNVYSVLQDSTNLMLMQDGGVQWNMLQHYDDLVHSASNLNLHQVSVVSLTSDPSSQQATSQQPTSHQTTQDFFTQPIAVTAHTWSVRVNGWCLLAVAHANADAMVAVWRFSVLEKQFSLQWIVNVGMHACKRMTMFQNNDELCLCVSTEVGRVVVLCFEVDEHSTKHTHSFSLWNEADLIHVDHMLYHPQSDRLLVSKSNNILCYNHFSERPFRPVIINVNCKYHISGILATDDDYIITTYDGTVSKLAIKDNSQPSIQTLAVEWSSEDWKIAGACLSHQHNYLLCALTPAHYFCTRKNKQPYIVNYMRLRSLKDVCERVLNYREGPLSNIYELLCSINADAGVEEVCGMVEEFGDWSALAITPLKVIRWLFCLLSSRWHESHAEKEEMKGKVRMVERMILHKHLTSKLQHLPIHHDNLSSREKLSHSLIKAFLGLQPLQSCHQSCPVCHCEIQEENHEKALCVKGHSFARCSQSLLLLASLKHRVCSLCNAPALSITKKKGALLVVLLTDCCSYCDALLSAI